MPLSYPLSFIHSFSQVKGVEPYVLHMTWTYNGIPGKRSRLRDMGLWRDPPAYYSNGSFVTVDLQLPEVGGSWGNIRTRYAFTRPE